MTASSDVQPVGRNGSVSDGGMHSNVVTWRMSDK